MVPAVLVAAGFISARGRRRRQCQRRRQRSANWSRQTRDRSVDPVGSGPGSAGRGDQRDRQSPHPGRAARKWGRKAITTTDKKEMIVPSLLPVLSPIVCYFAIYVIAGGGAGPAVNPMIKITNIVALLLLAVLAHWK
jgi:hypothetical protein